MSLYIFDPFSTKSLTILYRQLCYVLLKNYIKVTFLVIVNQLFIQFYLFSISPLLFLIHINDLQNKTSLKSLNFADDTMFYKIFIKEKYLNYSKNFNKGLKKVSDCFMGNKVKLYFKKTRSMIRHQSKNSFWKNIDLNVKIV